MKVNVKVGNYLGPNLKKLPLYDQLSSPFDTSAINRKINISVKPQKQNINVSSYFAEPKIKNKSRVTQTFNI